MPKRSLSETDLSRLRDILAAIEVVERYCVRVSEARFIHDYILQDAVIRRIMIIGEAATRLSQDAKRLLPGIPWPQIISMRHILVHDYSDIEEATVWRTVRHDLPELRKLLLGAIDFARGTVR